MNAEMHLSKRKKVTIGLLLKKKTLSLQLLSKHQTRSKTTTNKQQANTRPIELQMFNEPFLSALPWITQQNNEETFQYHSSLD